MEHINFARVNFNTKKVSYITSLLLKDIVNNQGQIDLKFCNDYLKTTIPDSKYDIWIKLSDDLGKGCGIGYTYDEELEAFIPPKLFNSWSLNTETFEWDPPIPKPELTEEQIELGCCEWNEEIQEWEFKTYT
jgi:hypothetical protein